MSDAPDIVERLRKIRKRIGWMCANHRAPRMSVPVDPDDDDIFICETAEEAAAEITHLRALIPPEPKP